MIEAALKIVVRAFRLFITKKRMIMFRQLPGMLICRDYHVNKNSGSFEVMHMHMIYNHIDHKCMHLRFTIFDYATKRFEYIGIYEELDHVTKFNVQLLCDIVRPSICLIPFETSPFRIHIATMQAVIDDNIPKELPSHDLYLYSSSSSSYSSESSVEEIVPITPPPELKAMPTEPKECFEIEVQTDVIPEEIEEPPTPDIVRAISTRWAAYKI